MVEIKETGRFHCLQQLEHRVKWLYFHSSCNNEQIARFTHVSVEVVSDIINNHKEENYEA